MGRRGFEAPGLVGRRALLGLYRGEEHGHRQGRYDGEQDGESSSIGASHHRSSLWWCGCAGRSPSGPQASADRGAARSGVGRCMDEGCFGECGTCEARGKASFEDSGASGARSEGAAMGENRACRYEPEGTRVLERRENRGGGGGTFVLVRDGRRTGPRASRQHGPLPRLYPLYRTACRPQMNTSPPYVGAKFPQVWRRMLWNISVIYALLPPI